MSALSFCMREVISESFLKFVFVFTFGECIVTEFDLLSDVFRQ